MQLRLKKLKEKPIIPPHPPHPQKTNNKKTQEYPLKI